MIGNHGYFGCECKCHAFEGREGEESDASLHRSTSGDYCDIFIDDMQQHKMLNFHGWREKRVRLLRKRRVRIIFLQVGRLGQKRDGGTE